MLIFKQDLGLISEELSHSREWGIIAQGVNFLDGIVEIVDFLETCVVHISFILVNGDHDTLNPSSMGIMNIYSGKSQRNTMYPLLADGLVIKLGPEDILGVRELKTEIWVLNIEDLHCDPFVIVGLLEINVLSNFKEMTDD